MVRWPSVVVVAVALAAAVIACGEEEEVLAPNAALTPSASPSASPSPTSSAAMPSATPSPSPAPAKLTYTEPLFGYSFDYPADWYLSPTKENGGSPILYSYDPSAVAPEEAGKPVPRDKLKAFFWVAKGVTQPLQEWLAATPEPGQPPTPKVTSEEEVMVAGREAVFQVTQNPETSDFSYYIRLNSSSVLVINAGPADSDLVVVFEQVISSLRFSS